MVSNHNEGYAATFAMKRTFGSCMCVSAMSLMMSCSTNTPVSAPHSRIVFPTVPTPVLELCTDDTLSRTDYINVPIVRFAGSKIELNGAQWSEQELLEWAQGRYKSLPEEAL